ncbi:MAG TPA: ATP-binding protein [Kofleriaceae bacterium]|nr:ATP-binding protein [Kofleriaceae bacterium]
MTELDREPLKIKAVMGSSERRGAWKVPALVEAHVSFGNMELDLREAEMGPDTTIEAYVKMGNLEIIVPSDLAVDVNVDSIMGNVEQGARDGHGDGGEVQVSGSAAAGQQLASHAYRDPTLPPQKRLRVTGKVKLGNCEIIPLRAGETREDYARRIRHIHRMRHGHHMHGHHGRHQRHDRWREIQAERELWKTEPGKSPWLPWWLQAQMRRRIFSWFVITFAFGVLAGVKWVGSHPWWHFIFPAILLSITSGWVSWRLTRPLLMVVKAARDIGDGKLDTRLHTSKRGEMRVLASAINDMASRIEQQIKDQRQLLAAVSHELRTPLGHMRVLVETARDTKDPKVLEEIDKEIVTLDDLVGRLLASSRLEFGNLDRRELDLGELIAEVANSAGIAPDKIEAVGDVHAKVDPTLVRRAIANLLDNARVHGGGAIAVRAVRRGHQVAIEVDDAGPGVQKDRRADAFRAFVPSSGGGLGLGLALVSRIAVAHEGGAWIDDRPGGGARVGFTVSVAPPAAA